MAWLPYSHPMRRRHRREDDGGSDARGTDRLFAPEPLGRSPRSDCRRTATAALPCRPDINARKTELHPSRRPIAIDPSPRSGPVMFSSAGFTALPAEIGPAAAR